ncbi:unnamed protein product (macronuclear) [Paramecium tetraurelia]|uniref:MIR domain-containing protein n=1 Tax=Paramecium tetraurelia TaxID=5888 RepID=A0DWW0_PARTE|nr:uncharacterized protein GSPATT00021170001 [Paramecium tetraurelia]CAK87527.1 unnamed protein product [Paramecium tetraurelia]|eukprot:XP_001454924.1 hypothetical protein (macronuclear) [Paramecium tetraurelia strain d4-2]
MQQAEKQRIFLHQELVTLFHPQQKVYLTDSNTENKQGLILSAQPDLSPNTIFILEKYCPPFSMFKTPNYYNTPIIQGDLIRIKSFCSNYYVTSIPDQQSPITKQGLMVLAKQNDVKYNGGEQVFILQNISNESPYMRLVNTETGLALHTHTSKLKEANNNNEVTGYKSRDNNDAWNIEVISKEMREGIHQQEVSEPLPRKCQTIRSSDSVIIRSGFTGGALHSHSACYKYGTKQQEVTWKIQPRDLNDWWVIYKIKNSSGESSQLIENNSLVSFLHVQTKQLLTHSQGCKVKNGDYLQVCCSKKSSEEFKIECKC